jgi:hypothetical protein
VTALSPLLISAALGYFTLAILLRETPLRWKKFFLLAASIPTGFGLCSLILFFSLWIIPSQAMAASLTSGLALTLFLGGFLLWRHFGNASHAETPFSPFRFELFRQKLSASIPKDKKTALKSALWAISFLIFLITLWSVIQFFLLSVSTNITGGWDARYMWSLKAKFMFRSPEAWQGMFSPVISWSHGDYPLLWPGTLAWGWNWMGQESLLWPPWASLCFYISCTLILVWYLGTQVSPLAGWWGGTFFLVLIPPLFWSIHLYADLPLAFFMTASALTLLAALRSGQTGLFLVSGLMAGLAAWTKNEGLQFLVAMSLLLGGLKIFGNKRTPSRPSDPPFPFFWGSCLPFVTLLIFKIFFGKTGEYLGSGHSIGSSLVMIFSKRSGSALIFHSFADHWMDLAGWKGLWLFFFAACIVGCFKKNRSSYAGILPVLIVLLNFGYFLAFLISPADLTWHLRTALQRLLIHTAPLALVFIFETLTIRSDTPGKQNGQTA